MNVDTFEKNIAYISILLKALSNENRLKILCALHRKEHKVGDLEKAVGLSQSALSQHLARLKRDGLVTARRQAQTIYYRMHDKRLYDVMKSLHDIYCQKTEL